MQLLYLWVQKYGIFVNREFNFSGQYHFHFDAQNKFLKCTYNESFPSRLYYSDNVSLISFIVGDNGDGKTTLMNLIMEMLPYEGGISGDCLKVIYALKEDKGDRVYLFTTLDKIRIETDKSVITGNCAESALFKMEMDKRNFYSCREMMNTEVIFHTNVFDRNRYNTQNILYGVEDLSFNGLLKRDFKYRGEDLANKKLTELRIFMDADILRQISYISELYEKGAADWIPFPLPQTLNMYFKSEPDMLKDILQYHEELFVPRRIFNYSFTYADNDNLEAYNLDELRSMTAHVYMDIMRRYRKLFSSTQRTFRNHMNKGILMSYLKCVFPDTAGTGSKKQFIHLFMSLKQFMKFSKFRSDQEFVKKLIRIVAIDTEPIIKAIDELNRLASMDENSPSSKDIKFYKNNKQYAAFYIPATSNGEIIKKFYQNYRRTALGAEYLSFQWSGLSSGEYNLLNMYSRIYSLCHKFENREERECNAIILLIDEADLSYHPKWQQKYIDSLIKFLNVFYRNYYIQVIVSTHSPIMLSDAVAGNVVFMNRAAGQEIEKTFGANIYDLFRDGMFLEDDDLGIIGAYAAGKINSILEQLDRWEALMKADSRRSRPEPEELEEIQKLIHVVGDPVTQRILQDRLNEIRQQIRKDSAYNGNVMALVEELNRLNPEELRDVRNAIERIEKK